MMKITTNNDNLSDDEDKENKTNSQISEKEELDPYLNNEGNYVNNIILGISDIKNHKYVACKQQEDGLKCGHKGM